MRESKLKTNPIDEKSTNLEEKKESLFEAAPSGLLSSVLILKEVFNDLSGVCSKEKASVLIQKSGFNSRGHRAQELKNNTSKQHEE